MDPTYRVVDVGPGLWIWRFPHPDWSPPDDGDRRVTSTRVVTGGEVIVLDPLSPPAEATEIWARLDAQPPTMAVVLKPDHVRSVDAFVERYACRAFGPESYSLDDLPTCEVEPIWPGDDELPGGIQPLYDGRSRNETPMWLRPSSERSSSPMDSPLLAASFRSGGRPGTSRPWSLPCALSWISPSSA